MADRRVKFKTVAERRTNSLLNALRLLGQCSNRRTYDYTEEETRKIFREVDREIKRVKESFDENHRRSKFEL